jgi:hypothetical protein
MPQAPGTLLPVVAVLVKVRAGAGRWLGQPSVSRWGYVLAAASRRRRRSREAFYGRNRDAGCKVTNWPTDVKPVEEGVVLVLLAENRCSGQEQRRDVTNTGHS